MLSLHESCMAVINPHKAAELLSYNTMVAQRTLSVEWANYLMSIIQRGKFRSGEIGVAILPYNGNKMVLVNGQHQLRAVVDTRIPIRVKYEEFICTTPADLSDLYETYDTHKQRRLNDFIRIRSDELNIHKALRFCNIVVVAAALAEGVKAPQADKAKLLAKYNPFLDFCAEIICTSKGGIRSDAKHLTKSPVIYAIILTHRRSPENAMEFWTSVRDGANLAITDPAYHLRNWLMTTVYAYGRGARRANRASQHEYISRCVVAWNGFRDKRELMILKYYPEREIPRAK